MRRTQTGFNCIIVTRNQSLGRTGSITFSNNSNLTSRTPSSLTTSATFTLNAEGNITISSMNCPAGGRGRDCVGDEFARRGDDF